MKSETHASLQIPPSADTSWHGLGASWAALLSTPDRLRSEPGLRAAQTGIVLRRLRYWIHFLLLSSILLWLGARSAGTQTAQPLLFHIPLSLDMPTWVCGVWIIAACGLLMLQRLTISGNSRPVTESLVLGFVFLISAWWSLGIYTLANQPNSTNFVVANRTFIWLTALGHVITVALLASNIRMVVTTIVVSCLAPGLYFFFKTPIFQIASVYWLSGQMAAFIFVTVVVHIDQRQLLSERMSVDRERLKAESERRTAELARQVAEDERRAAETARRNAELQRQTAENLKFEKTQLLDSFSHDLMQPLTALEFQLEDMKRRTNDQGIQGILAEAAVQKSSMVMMLETARDLADADAGEYPCHPREVSLQEMLKEVFDSHKRSALSQGKELSVFCPPILVRSDRDLLIRIVGNFVQNALKFSRTQGGHVLVGCRRKGDAVVISVHDNGIGFRSEDKDRIFKEYVQLDNPERSRKKGLGLGLAIAKAFARLLNENAGKHALDAESIPGRGSVFAITVPYVGRLPTEVGPLRSAPKPLSLVDKVAILVEDEDSQRREFTKYLENLGCRVISATSVQDMGREIRENFSDGDGGPDFLITDYRLGTDTGADAIKAARSYFPGVPAIIWSANASPKVMATVEGSGVKFIPKGRLRLMREELQRIADREERASPSLRC